MAVGSASDDPTTFAQTGSLATQEQRGRLAFAFVDRRQTKVYEYAVLVTDLFEGILSVAQLYRD